MNVVETLEPLRQTENLEGSFMVGREQIPFLTESERVGDKVTIKCLL